MNCFIKSLNEGRGKHILELMNNDNCQQSTGCETVSVLLFFPNNVLPVYSLLNYSLLNN